MTLESRMSMRCRVGHDASNEVSQPADRRVSTLYIVFILVRLT